MFLCPIGVRKAHDAATATPIKNGSGLIFSCSGGDKTHPNPNCLEINILFGCINLLGCLGNFCRNHPNERYVVVPYAIQTIEPTS